MRNLQFVNEWYSIRKRLRSRANGSDSPSEHSASTVICICYIGRHFRKFSRKLCRELRSESRALLHIAWFHVGRDVKIYTRVKLFTNIMFIKHGVRNDLNVQTNTRRLITSTCIWSVETIILVLWCTMMLIIYTSERYVIAIRRILMGRRRCELWCERDRSRFTHRLHSQNRSRVSTVHDQHTATSTFLSDAQ